MAIRVIHLLSFIAFASACTGSLRAEIVTASHVAPVPQAGLKLTSPDGNGNGTAIGLDLAPAVRPLDFGQDAHDLFTAPPVSGLMADGGVNTLPPPPGSFQLVLGGLGTIGAWSLSRYARKSHLSHLPEWYQELGPHQVGHATAFDLEDCSLQICWFELPQLDPPADRFTFRVETVVPVAPQWSHPPAAPRGPPLLAG